MNIDTPQSSIAPQPPRDPMEKPSEPIRKPGLARATTNPSHHRSDLRSSRSSMATVATDSSPLSQSERAPSYSRGLLHPGEFLISASYRLRQICRLPQSMTDPKATSRPVPS